MKMFIPLINKPKHKKAEEVEVSPRREKEKSPKQRRRRQERSKSLQSSSSEKRRKKEKKRKHKEKNDKKRKRKLSSSTSSVTGGEAQGVDEIANSTSSEEPAHAARTSTSGTTACALVPRSSHPWWYVGKNKGITRRARQERHNRWWCNGSETQASSKSASAEATSSG